MKEHYIGTNRIVTDHDKQRTMFEWYVRGGSGLTLRLWRRWRFEIELRRSGLGRGIQIGPLELVLWRRGWH